MGEDGKGKGDREFEGGRENVRKRGRVDERGWEGKG